ncbi:MAG TPA: PQQ-binding-like beta-propeller repeat protein [Blastocatellia bacterium]|nr:PQQ-binding-like beta-propeller repeat protein [Blastocatellia bacterium]
MQGLKAVILFAMLLSLAWLGRDSAAQQKTAGDRYREWRMFGGGPENIHYSALRQITRDNVSQLKVAWIYDTGDAFRDSEMQCNPVIVDGVLYATTPRVRVIALNAATSELKWSFDPSEGKKATGKMRNRGVNYWQSGNDKRIFFGFRNRLYALDAVTGQLVKAFGEAGRVDLREGLGRDPQGVTITLTTPGVIYEDLLIIGSLVSEALPSAPGHIRAYDVRTGKLRWTFRTIPQPGEPGYDTWPKDAWQYTGGANNRAGMALDEKRGLVFVPTGSAAFDFYGANRHGDKLFANTLLCPDARTGKRSWHFQPAEAGTPNTVSQ